MLGVAAGTLIAAALRQAIALRGQASVIFGSAPSQNETLSALGDEDLDWSRITAFHLDEYVGASEVAPYSFRRYLIDHLFSRRPPRQFHAIDGQAASPEHECERYAALLAQHSPDVALLGIGENGHLAFNDPPADFEDPLSVRLVHLAQSCREQQVADGVFSRLEFVPRTAITLTIPTLIRVPQLFVMVPGPSKARAVKDALLNAISPLCPASILRTHPAAILFLDPDSAAGFTEAVKSPDVAAS
jgi:glucosamine-6-phosphate deaminase